VHVWEDLRLEPTEIYDVGSNGKLILVLRFFFFRRVSGFMGKLSLQANYYSI
jgi:hypothetical protein